MKEEAHFIRYFLFWNSFFALSPDGPTAATAGSSKAICYSHRRGTTDFFPPSRYPNPSPGARSVTAHCSNIEPWWSLKTGRFGKREDKTVPLHTSHCSEGVTPRSDTLSYRCGEEQPYSCQWPQLGRSKEKHKNVVTTLTSSALTAHVSYVNAGTVS